MIIIVKNQFNKIIATNPVKLKTKLPLGKIGNYSYYIKNIKRDKNIGKGSKYTYFGEVFKKGNKHGKEYFSIANNLKEYKKNMKDFIKIKNER